MSYSQENPSSLDENSVDHQRLNNLIRYINTLILEGDYLSEKPANQIDKLLYLVYSSQINPRVADSIKDYFFKKAEGENMEGDVFLISDEKLSELMALCENEKERGNLKDIVIYLNRLYQKGASSKEESGKEMQKKDILALVEADFLHWRIANFFRIKLRHFLSEKLNDEATKKELKEYWESCEKKKTELPSKKTRPVGKKRKSKALKDVRLDIGPEEEEGERVEKNLHALTPEIQELRAMEAVIDESQRSLPKKTPEKKIKNFFGPLLLVTKRKGGDQIHNFRMLNGQLVSEKWFTSLRFSEAEQRMAVIFEEGRHNFLTPKGDFLSKEGFDWANAFHEGRAKVLIGAKWSFIREDGSFLLSDIPEKVEGAKVASMSMRFPHLEFDEADDFKDGFAKVKKGGESFLIDLNGQRHEPEEEIQKHEEEVKIFPPPPWMTAEDVKKEADQPSVFDAPPIDLPDTQVAQPIPLLGSADKPQAISLPASSEIIENERTQISPFDQPIPSENEGKQPLKFPIPIPVPTEEDRKNYVEAALLKQAEMLRSAQHFYKNSDYYKALACYQSALKVSTNGHTKIFQRISACYFREGDLENAIKALERVLERKPENERAVFTLIYKFLVLKYKNDIRGTIEAFEEILRKNNKPLEELDEEVKKEFEKGYLQLEIQNVHSTFALALNKTIGKQLTQELDQTFRRYKELVTENPEGNFQHREMARKLRKLNENSRIGSEAVFFAHSQDLTRHPGNYEAIAELGCTHFTFGTYESLMKASEYLMEALSINPEPSGHYEWIKDMVLKEIPRKIAYLRKMGLTPVKK